jgi:nucleoside-diphosphate-sugar epimerase
MTLCLIGASGFVGRRVLERSNGPVRALLHRNPVDAAHVVTGNATERASLDRLLEPGSVAINAAYAAGQAERLAEELGAACAARGVRRLVHLSTVSVYGAAPGRIVDEDTPCVPRTPYEREKHAAEAILERHAAGRFELVLLRPAAVFGPGGRNLETLALRVRREPWPRRYLRACAMGQRRMHAVDVDCVAHAALYATAMPLRAPAETFVVSQDEEPGNDYAAIEDYFVRRFAAAPYPVPLLPVPPAVLGTMLRLAGRSDAEPNRRYSAARLASRGFRAPRSFAAGLEEYAAWMEQRARS